MEIVIGQHSESYFIFKNISKNRIPIFRYLNKDGTWTMKNTAYFDSYEEAVKIAKKFVPDCTIKNACTGPGGSVSQS